MGGQPAARWPAGRRCARAGGSEGVTDVVVVAVVVVVHVPARVRLRIVVIHHVGEERGEIEKVQRREGGRGR